jgi:hypothetical protein
MFKMHATGSYSLGDLANFAEHNGFANNFYKHGKAKTLSKNTISAMLKEPFYYGEQYVKKYNRKYEPLISKALYDECQRVTQIRS